MYTLFFLGCVSFALSLLLTPLVRNLFRRWGVIDHPDNKRKQHERAVPRVGGVAIAISFACAFGLALLFPGHGGSIIREAIPFALWVLPAALLIFLVGLVDDVIGLKPWQKFAGQVVAAGAAYWAGIHVQAFGGHIFSEWWSFPLTVFWLVLCTNAVNLIDGVDGLAAGIGLFASATTLLAALVQGNFELAIATAPLVGCLAGFLRYNFNPATIFLGDSGSMFIGFLLGCYGVLWSNKSATILGMTAPLMALSIPLLDTALAIVRRFLKRQPIFGADRGHIHHRLLDRGHTPRKVALVLYGVCALGAISSMLIASPRFEGLALVLFCAGAWFGIQHLNYVEFGIAGRMFMQGAFRQQLSGQIALQDYEKLLRSAATPQECWSVIESACREFGFNRARVLAGEFTFEYEPQEQAESWTIVVPISDSASIELARPFGAPGHASIIAPFSDMLHRTLALKLGEFAKLNEKPRYHTVSRGLTNTG